ncbi:AAA domain protein [Novymonas esmeraldas]|uniref:AAA domain protein n=1 Tax=Novymonas esmeraldas TaxID=1808958 RepID=A0AAW0EYL8_9TRYP
MFRWRLASLSAPAASLSTRTAHRFYRHPNCSTLVSPCSCTPASLRQSRHHYRASCLAASSPLRCAGTHRGGSQETRSADARRAGTPAMSHDDVDVPCSTQLTIGDVVIPVPDYALHPERVAWASPGVDHTAPYLRPHAASSGSPGASASVSADPTAGLPSLGGGGAAAEEENMFFTVEDPLTRSYLRWIAQKEQLGQDMCLIGDPGPAMRWLVMLYSHLTRREIRVVYLNSDITESDLKQRREIRNGSLVYDDQSAVSAAVEGQLLVLEGLERVERNVLPVINNLLENREMHLDNGSVLIHPARYDSLLHNLYESKLQHQRHRPRSDGAADAVSRAGLIAEAKHELAQMGLVRVSEKFRVIGITVPVPPYEGNPLDPPLRSRFQCLYVRTPMPVVSPSSSVVSALSISGDGGGAGNLKRSKQVAELQERQSARFAQVAQLRAAITAINDSTRDFQLSRPSKRRTAPAAPVQGRRRNPYAPMQHSGDVVEHLFGNDADASAADGDDEGDGAEGGAAAASSPLQTMGHWALATIAQQLALYPDLPVGEAVARGFPWPHYARQLTRIGAGGAATGYANVEEHQRRLAQYAEVLQHCHVYPPLLLQLAADSAAAADGAHARRGSRDGDDHRRTSGTKKKLRLGERLRAAVRGDGVDAADGESSGAAAARAYVRSGQVVSAATASTSVPLAVQQACNYILQLRHVQSTGSFSGVPVVVAEAVVATAAHDAVHPGEPGTYPLKIFMGPEALSSASGGGVATDGSATAGRDVVDYLATTAAPSTVITTEHYHVLQTMLHVHASRQHICLLGATGCGKTAMVRAFGRLLGYTRASTMHLYADMTHKDLFQQRMTDPQTGNTTWQDSPLLHAAVHGELVVLDGMEKLPGGMLASLQQILVDQSAVLADGTLLKSPTEYNILKERLTRRDPVTGAVTWQPSDAEMRERKIYPVHPCFRAVATARPPMPVSGSGGGSGSGRGTRNDFFITPDLTTLFRIVAMPDAGDNALGPVLRQVAQAEARLLVAETWRRQEAATALQQRVEAVVEQLLRLRNELEELHSTDGKMPQLSLRQLRQLVRSAVRYPSRVEESVRNTLLLPLMTGVVATKVRHALETCGLAQPEGRGTGTGRGTAAEHECLTLEAGGAPHGSSAAAAVAAGRLWSVSGAPVLRLSRVYTQPELALVPYVTGFHTNRVHESILAWLAKQYAMGSNILLIGNQGVGKNKVVDAFLSRLGLPRHYIQLHRDTTVGSLTINPTVEAGKVVWEDSPLVKAVQRGHCLVVDEIDKAPVEVVQVLKGLIEDREMRLGDGRQIHDPAMELRGSVATPTPTSTSTQRIPIHPDFRIVVLANPPGFPFHGNDFFRECGDLFAAYVMGNPDAESQLRVLSAYAPALPRSLLERLVQVFMELQSAFTQGNLTYPFSLRELIAVVKHMSRYPQDGVYEALNNVFNFDARDENTLRLVRQVLANYLQPMIQQGGLQRLRPYKAGQPTPLLPFKQLVTLPMSATTGTHAAHFAALVSLPAEVVLDSGRLLSHIVAVEAERAGRSSTSTPSEAAAVAEEASAWRATYPTESFFPAAATALPSSSSASVDAFTEWASQCELPFIDPATDTVAAVTSVTAVGGSSSSSSGLSGDDCDVATLPLLSALLLRRPAAAGAPPRLIVATVRLPPSSIDARYLVADTAEELAALWPVGHVRFVDVSSSYAAELAAATSPSFAYAGIDMAAQALPWVTDGDTGGEPRQRRVWPPSLAEWADTHAGRTSLLQSSAASTGAAGTARAPQGIVLLSSTATGRTVLVDVLAGAAADLYMARAGVTTAAAATTAESRRESASTASAPAAPLGAVLPLHLDRCLSTTSASSRVRILDVSARHGIVCFTAAGSAATAECYFLLRGHLVRVTFAQPVASLRFVGDHVAAVEMVPTATAAGEAPRRAGIVKVSVGPDGTALATMLPLSPEVQHLALVEAPAAAAAAVVATGTQSGASHGTLVPADLEGSVWRAVRSSAVAVSASPTPVPGGHGASAADVDDPAGGDVVYARAEGPASEQGLQLRYYKSKSGAATALATTGSTAAGAVLVDDGRHQLLHVQADGRTLSAVDTHHGTQRTLASIPGAAAAATATSAAMDRWSLDSRSGTVYAWQSAARRLSVGDVDGERVRQRYSEWSSLLTGNSATVGDAATVEEGEEEVKDFKMKYSTPRKQPSGTLKHGEVDDQEHHGGNNWAGGTGGTDTAGLGGMVGPYRLDKGNPVHQVSPEEKRKVPKHLLEEARRMGREALKERLQSIGMSAEEYEQYKGLQERVRPAVAQLRTLLMGLKAAEGERVWVTGQTDGVWDDKKLVEGIVGEKNVYKRRVDSKDADPFRQTHKKRLVFVLDVSASMYRFNSMDQRLTKLLETTIMIMEAFAGFEAKLDYAMIGHNGDSDNIPLVNFGAAPANQKERMVVCQKMLAYAQYCWSGDNTVEAMRRSVELVTKEKGDSYFVFVISDANLRQYGITPRELTEIIQSKPEVKMFCIFIATLGAQASHLQQQLPAGHGYECMRTDVLPQVLRQIFTSANLF